MSTIGYQKTKEKKIEWAQPLQLNEKSPNNAMIKQYNYIFRICSTFSLRLMSSPGIDSLKTKQKKLDNYTDTNYKYLNWTNNHQLEIIERIVYVAGALMFRLI